MTGPVNAILSSSGPVRFHFVGAYLWAALAVAFGLLSPVVTELALSVPESFIYIIGGLAMLPVLQQAFTAGFGGRFAIGATVSLVVTVTDLIPGVDVNLLGIGAPFWGLVFGAATSLLLERRDYADLIAAGNGAPAPRRQDEEEPVDTEAAPKALSGPGPGRTPADAGQLPGGPIAVISPAPGPDASRVLIALREKGLGLPAGRGHAVAPRRGRVGKPAEPESAGPLRGRNRALRSTDHPRLSGNRPARARP